MKIYLIGYMGSGKSTLGHDLAVALGISWIDIDDEFELKYKISISHFLTKYGEMAWDLSDKIAAHMAKMGIKSFFAFDVAVSAAKHGKLELHWIECNPRFNGSTYPTLLSQKLGVENWFSRKFHLEKSFTSFDFGPVEYSPRKKEGIVIVNWGPDDIGVMIVAPTRAGQKKFEEKMLNIIH